MYTYACFRYTLFKVINYSDVLYNSWSGTNNIIPQSTSAHIMSPIMNSLPVTLESERSPPINEWLVISETKMSPPALHLYIFYTLNDFFIFKRKEKR